MLARQPVETYLKLFEKRSSGISKSNDGAFGKISCEIFLEMAVLSCFWNIKRRHLGISARGRVEKLLKEKGR